MSATLPDDLTARVAVLGHIARDTRDALARIDHRFDKVDARFDKFDARLDRIESGFERRLDRMDGRIDKMFWAMLGGFVSLLGVVAHGFKWI